VRAINSLCVHRGLGGVAAEQWPTDGRCFRGGGLPDWAKRFFQVDMVWTGCGFDIGYSVRIVQEERFANFALYFNPLHTSCRNA
jgi:hypothetical protein